MKDMLFPIFFLFIFGCQKGPAEPPEPTPCEEPCDTMEMKLLWQSPIGADTGDYGASKPVLYKDKVIVTKMFGGSKDILICRDRDGEILWKWDNPQDIYDGEFIGGEGSQNTFSEKLILCSHHEINVVDMEAGKLLWRSDANDKGGCGWPRINLFSDQIYHTHKPCGVFPDSSYLVRSSVYAPRWDTLFRLGPTESGVAPAIEPGVLWVSGQGDSIYIFQNRAADSHGNQVDVYGFNLAERKVVWKMTTPEKGSSVLPPVVYQNRVYFNGLKTLWCLNPIDGSVIWSKTFDAALYFSNVLFTAGKLVVHPNNHSIYALNPETGAEIWKNLDTGGSPTELSTYHGYIFYASGGSDGIYIHRVSDGALVKRILSPNRHDFGSVLFVWPIAIDESTGRLYTTDGRFVLCYQIKL